MFLSLGNAASAETDQRGEGGWWSRGKGLAGQSRPLPALAASTKDIGPADQPHPPPVMTPTTFWDRARTLSSRPRGRDSIVRASASDSDGTRCNVDTDRIAMSKQRGG